MSIAAVCMTVACLLIMGSFSLIAINANHVLGDLEDDNQFLAYIDETSPGPRPRRWKSQIKAVPNVADIHFSSPRKPGRPCLTTLHPSGPKLGDDNDLYSTCPPLCHASWTGFHSYLDISTC